MSLATFSSSSFPVSPERVNILGVGISSLNLYTATQISIKASLSSAFLGYVTVTGVHGVMESQKDRELQRVHNNSFLSTPDGMPMVWMGQWSGFDNMDRVYGPDLMLQVTETGLPLGLGHYYFGGKEEVVTTLREKIVSQFKGVNICGIESPPFHFPTLKEQEALALKLAQSKPHFLWVGLGTPKQEKFMADFVKNFPNLTKDWEHGLVLLGVGAAFDFHAQYLKQAPLWMQKNGLEWLFRLCMEPRRLWKRYSINNSRFIFQIIPAMMGLKKYPLNSRE